MQMNNNGDPIWAELIQIKKQITVLTLLMGFSILMGIINVIMIIWAVQL